MAANNPSRIHTRHSHPHPYHHRFVIIRNEATSELCQSTPTNMFAAVMPPALPWVILSSGSETYEKIAR
jgi:hypothetical protein